MKSTVFDSPLWLSLQEESHPSLDTVRIAPCFFSEGALVLSQKTQMSSASLLECQRQLKLGSLSDRGGFALYLDEEDRVWALVNLGKIDQINVEFLLKTFATLGKFLLKKSKAKWHLDFFPSDYERENFIYSALEALLLAQYPVAKSGLFVVESLSTVYNKNVAWIDIEARAYGVHFARGMINANADLMTPIKMAQLANEFASSHSDRVRCHILDEKDLAKESMGLLLAVARASREPPRLIILEYTPENLEESKKAPIAWVGKGVSYDTGGFSLKPQDSMKGQRADMSGAATVFGAFQAAVKLKVKEPLIAVLACVENAIGSAGYKLGDVYVSRSGKTIEVVNTDAEGRLVLADAFDYVQEKFSPRIMIDLATLTGAVIMGLGHEAAAILSTDEALQNKLIEASKESGERLWPLPLYPEYKEYLSSEIADMKNAGPRVAGTCVAGIFLKQFVKEGVLWAHMDIAGVAFQEKEMFHFHRLSTGFGVRTLLNWLLP